MNTFEKKKLSANLLEMYLRFGSSVGSLFNRKFKRIYIVVNVDYWTKKTSKPTK